MRRLAAALLLADFTLSCSAGIAHAEELASNRPPATIPLPIFLEVDRLLLQQDQAAAGSPAAAEKQKALLVKIGELLEAAPDSQYPVLAPYAISYILSGGNPDFGDRMSADKVVLKRDQRLLKGTALFMRGDLDAASALLADIDTRELPARLAGRLALAQALLTKDGKKQERLSFAISAMPGTLIEESALRRSALGYVETFDKHDLWSRLDRYARRFPNSVYAAEFWKDMMVKIAGWRGGATALDLQNLDAILARLELSKRRLVYIELARAAAVTGQPALADFAGRRVKRLSASDSSEAKLGVFFSALYEVVSIDGDNALAALRATPRSILTVREKALLDAALALGRQIERPPRHSSMAEDTMTEKGPLELRGSELLSRSHQLAAGSN